MEEILAKIENEIESIKEEQAKLEELAEKSEKLQDEKKQLEEELKTIADTKSGFYQDIKEQVDKKQEEFTDINNARMQKDKELDNLIADKKAQIQKEIAEKKQYLDDNRNVDLEDLKTIDVDKLRAEKEKLEKAIELNNVTKEEFDKKTDSEKAEIRQAKENYLRNKKRLGEIAPKLQLIDTLDGKTPKERFVELNDLEKNVEANFDKSNLNNVMDSVNKAKEEADIEKLLEQMITGREKREEERYYEDVKSGLEETKQRKQREEKEEAKETKIQKEMDKIASIRIDEKNGTIYTETKGGKIEKELLSEAIAAKKNLNALLKVKEMCKEIAGGRISGLLLGTKVNPAIVYALRKEPQEIKNYITCLKEQKELPFELFHDLRDSSLNIMNRVKMWVHARAEDKLPGTTVILSDRRWNKNKAIEASKTDEKTQEVHEPFQMYKQVEQDKNKAEAQEVHEPFTMYKQVKRDKNKSIADYYVENSDNHIEKNATEKILREEQEKRAKEVEKFMPDTVEDKNGEVVADFEENR